MAANTINHPIRGSTAIGGRRGPWHSLRRALRAVVVFVDTAFRVVILGADGRPGAPRDD